jgi:hypothetical protein
MANEVEWTYAGQVTLEDSGASAASNAFVPANDDTLESGVHSNYPLADFVLKADFAAAVAAGGVVRLFRQDLNIDSTNDAPAPSASCEHLFVGSFVIPSGTSATGYYPLTDVPLAKDQQFSVQNKTSQSMSAGWDLKATPKTFNPGS